MKCDGNFKFRSLTKRQGGEFVNEKNKTIKYDDCYILSVDEEKDGKVYTIQFKVAKDSPFLKDLDDVVPFQDICIEFEIFFYRSNVRLIPISLLN